MEISVDFRIIPALLLTVLDLLETDLKENLIVLKFHIYTHNELSLIVVRIYLTVTDLDHFKHSLF